MDLKNVIIIDNIPVKDAAAMHGADIGFIWGRFEAFHGTVDLALEEHGWVPLTTPNPWPGHENPRNKQGWVEKSHCVIGSETKKVYTLEIAEDGTPSIRRVG